MNKYKVFSTTEIGKICGVNPTTVQQWIDNNDIKAYKTPGGHRRVLKKDLLDFMKRYGFPTKGV